jgi:hypothetical protein
MKIRSFVLALLTDGSVRTRTENFSTPHHGFHNIHQSSLVRNGGRNIFFLAISGQFSVFFAQE